MDDDEYIKALLKVVGMVDQLLYWLTNGQTRNLHAENRRSREVWETTARRGRQQLTFDNNLDLQRGVLAGDPGW